MLGDGERAIMQADTVHLPDRLLSLSWRTESDESITGRLASVSIQHNVIVLDMTHMYERCEQFIRGQMERKTAHEYLTVIIVTHTHIPHLVQTSKASHLSQNGYG